MGTPSSKPTLVAGALVATLVAGAFMSGPAAASDRVVIVQPGDTLSGIAARLGVSLELLVTRNRIADPDRILAGQRLRVPGRAGGGAKVHHRVRPGETLSGIAARYGTSVAAMAAANHLANPSLILSGQRLLVPGAVGHTGARPGHPAPRPRTHVVRPGETLGGIAARYGTSVVTLARLNGLADASYIQSGQVLRVSPGSGRPAAGSGMPASMAALVATRHGVRRVIAAEASRQGVPVALALALAWQESGWQQDVVSYAGAIGVMQLLPATADWVGSSMLGRRVNPHALQSNVRAGVVLLRHYLDRYGGDRSLALAAYYQGQRAVDQHGIYPISLPYIASILRLEQIFGG
jgi:LysM repeat protein